KEINEAYEVLSDADKRKRYDQLGPNWKAGEDFSRRRAGKCMKAMVILATYLAEAGAQADLVIFSRLFSEAVEALAARPVLPCEVRMSKRRSRSPSKTRTAPSAV